MRISLVLATVGRTDELSTALDSIASQHEQPVEVIVVDQNIDDRLVPIVRRAREQGLVMRHLHSQPQALSRARNVGLRAAVGDVVAFPDDDCWYEPTTLAMVSAAFREHPACDGLVAQWSEHAAMQTPNSSGSDGQVLSNARSRAFRDGDASSICLFLRRNLLERLGGFDESLGVGAWFGAAEETDVVLRALESGALIVRRPEVVVHHPCQRQDSPRRISSSEFRRVMIRARGTGALYAKHKLAPFVIFRGLARPLLSSLWPFGHRLSWLAAVALVTGRVQGFVRWRQIGERRR